MRYALIQSGRVATVVEQDSAPQIAGRWVECTGQRVGPGFLWDGAAFSGPPGPVWRDITAAAFWGRFAPADLVAYDVAMQHDPAASDAAKRQAAKLRIFKAELSDAGSCRLSRPKIANFVTGLEALGVLPAGSAAGILTTPITADEAAP